MGLAGKNCLRGAPGNVEPMGLPFIPEKTRESVTKMMKGHMDKQCLLGRSGFCGGKSCITGIWRKGSKYVDKGGCASIIILLYFQKAFEKLFVKLIKCCKETKLPQDWTRDLVLD